MIVLFDSACPMCSATVRLLAHLDKHHRLQFAGLTDPIAARLLGPILPNSVVALEGPNAFTESDAVIAIGRTLGYPAGLLRLIPRPIRNAAYRFIARHRLRFATGKSCTVDPRVQERFLHE